MARFGMGRGRRRERNIYEEPPVLDKLLAHFTDGSNEEVLPLTYGLYGVDVNCFKLSYGGETMIFEALEDPEDGYRSCLKCVERPGIAREHGLVFPNAHVALVSIRKVSDGYFDGWEFFNGDHVWLKVGTDNCDDYYPYFVFQYEPDRNYTVDYEPVHTRGQIGYMIDLVANTERSLVEVTERLRVLNQNFSMELAEELMNLVENTSGLKFLIGEVETLMDLGEE
jgi:hypothetical protein